MFSCQLQYILSSHESKIISNVHNILIVTMRHHCLIEDDTFHEKRLNSDQLTRYMSHDYIPPSSKLSNNILFFYSKSLNYCKKVHLPIVTQRSI